MNIVLINKPKNKHKPKRNIQSFSVSEKKNSLFRKAHKMYSYSWHQIAEKLSQPFIILKKKENSNC